MLRHALLNQVSARRTVSAVRRGSVICLVAMLICVLLGMLAFSIDLGVIGIAATRVVERYGRPTLVISRNGEEAHGSGRSISAFHLLQAIESCESLFTRYGGHAHAVGFALPSAGIPELRASLDSYARARLTLVRDAAHREIPVHIRRWPERTNEVRGPRLEQAHVELQLVTARPRG